MRNLNKDFENRVIDYETLSEYGFSKKYNYYFYEKNIYDNHFKVIVEISNKKQTARILDVLMNEEYILVDVEAAAGDFVGKVKEEYENILNDLIEKCSKPNVFKSKQAKKLIEYVKEKYDDDLEFLWKKFPNNAVLRNKDNRKWYGVLAVLPETKLGINSDKIVDIIVLRYQKEKIKDIVDETKVFKGYHMNKDNWITIMLDESLDLKEIYRLIDNSYKLAKEK